MPKELTYLYFGQQCPGTYMGEQARRTATLLGCPYVEIDISDRPNLAERYGLFFPGTIRIDSFQLVYPGRPEQIAASYKQRGPLPGVQKYQPLTEGQVERVTPLTPATAAQAFGCCIPGFGGEECAAKADWLRRYGAASGFCGLIGHTAEHVVGFVEVLPETAVPYPLGEKSPNRAFITCLYSPNEWGLERDYRVSLLQALMAELPQHGYKELSIICGTETPYPNGPEGILLPLGFERVNYMGKALLRHKWEEAWLLRAKLG